MDATPQQQAVNQLLDELVAFCQAHGQKCFGSFSPETLRDYLLFHGYHQSLVFMRDGAEIVGVAIAWQTNRAWLAEVAANGQHACDWRPTDPTGDCLMMAESVTSRPGVFPKLWQTLALRHPHWRPLPLYTFRRGQLVRMDYLKHRMLSKILCDTSSNLN